MQNEIRNIALFYGHVASNIGDLAINHGQIELLKQIFPDATVTVVLFSGSDKSLLETAQASFGPPGSVHLTQIRSSGRRALEHALHPDTFLATAGVGDSDLVVLASGEHLFSYEKNLNHKGIFWRLLPAVAAAIQQKRCVLLPSTFGPFEDQDVAALVAQVLPLIGGFAARESESITVLEKLGLTLSTPLLDPAFFIQYPTRPQRNARGPVRRLGIAMRSEGWGIRLSRESRTDTTGLFQEQGYTSSIAYQYCLSLAVRFLESTSTTVRLFVQTRADRDLALALLQRLRALGFATRVDIAEPRSIDEYVRMLGDVDHFVSSRFHALVLSIAQSKPVTGVFFDVHGHKIEGLFKSLNASERCINLSQLPFDIAATATLESISTNGLSADPAVLTRLKEQTAIWLKDAATRRLDREVPLTAYQRLVSLAVRLDKESSERRTKKSLSELQAQRRNLKAALLDERQARTKAEREAIARQNQQRDQAAEFRAALEFWRCRALERGELLFDLTARLHRAQRVMDRIREMIERSASQRSIEAQKAADLRTTVERLEKLNQAGKRKQQRRARLQRAMRQHAERLLVDEREAQARDHQHQLSFAHYRLERAQQARSNLRSSTSYRLGQILVQCAKRPYRLFTLPVALASLFRRPLNHTSAQPALKVADARLSALLNELLQQEHSREEEAQRMMALAKDMRVSDPSLAATLAREAWRTDPSIANTRWLAFRLFDAGMVSEPAALLTEDRNLSPSEKRKAETIGTYLSWSIQPPMLPAPDASAYTPDIDVILLFPSLTSSTAFDGLVTERWTAELRNIFPGLIDLGSSPAHHDEAGTTHTEIIRQLQAVTNEFSLEEATARSASLIEHAARKHRAAGIFASSRSTFAVPALFAARALRIPYLFEADGSSRQLFGATAAPSYNSERSRIEDQLLSFVARHADFVYARSEAVAEHLKAEGVSWRRMTLRPFARELSSSISRPKPSKLLKVAYIDERESDPDLEVLIDALHQVQRPVALKIYCRAKRGRFIREKISRLDHHLLSVADIRSFAAEPNEDIHAVVYPYLARDLGDLSAPPSLAVGRSLGAIAIASDLPGFVCEIHNSIDGFLFSAGDRRALANILETLAKDSKLRERLRERTLRLVHNEIERGREQLLSTLQRSIGPKLRRPEGATIASSGRTNKASPGSVTPLNALLERYADGGVDAVVDAVRERSAGPEQAARSLISTAKAFAAGGHPEAEFPLAKAAVDLCASEHTLRAMYWIAHRAREFSVASETITRLAEVYGPNPPPAKQELLSKLRKSSVALLSILESADRQPVESIQSIPNRLCYVLHNTLPLSSGGYATRSHGVATGMAAAGWDVVVLSRPGFPIDTKPELRPVDVAPIDVIDDIPYVRTLEPARRMGMGTQYQIKAADALEKRFREYRPALIAAASNHATALPALLAARRLGLPFVYEIRGFWEVTRMSRDREYEQSPDYQLQRTIEAGVATAADQVFTLTEAMREELIERGVPKSRIELLPNSCDPSRFRPAPRDEALARRLGIPPHVTVIGYIGTFVDYEGLEDLAAACGRLKSNGTEFRLLLVGNENTSGNDRGPITEEIYRIANEQKFTDWLIMPGRVPHSEVESYYSLIDIAPFPRKPWPVCEMVSPMKPLEALAMEKAVVVSSARALAELIEHERTGMVFTKANIDSLEATLRQLIACPELRSRLGKAGREWVKTERTWTRIGRLFSQHCAHLVKSSSVVTM